MLPFYFHHAIALFGEYIGKIEMSDDFNAPLPDEFWFGEMERNRIAFDSQKMARDPILQDESQTIPDIHSRIV